MKVLNKLKTLNSKIYPKHLAYAPSWIVLGVNNICNLHCKMCDVGVDYNKSNFFENLVGTRPLNMPKELIFDVIKQTAKHFPSSKIGYAFTEPLIYPHLVESLQLANELGLFTSVTTNALNLKRHADKLSSSGINEINISLDGPPDVHNFIRGHKSSFQKAIEGMTYLSSINKSIRFNIYCVITEWNIGRLVEFVDLFKDLPISHLGFMHTNFTPQSVADQHNDQFGGAYPATASNMQEIDIGSMNLEVLWEEIKRIKSKKYPFPVTFSPELNSEKDLDVFYHHPEIMLGKRCHDIYQNIMIKSNGDVIPAHGRCYNLTIGNLHDNNLKEIWNSEVIQKFRVDVHKAGGLLPACSRCCSGFGK